MISNASGNLEGKSKAYHQTLLIRMIKISYLLQDQLKKAKSITIRTYKGEEKGKFGRILGDIWCDGKSVNQLMCKVGHAVAYYGQNKLLIEKAHLKNRKRV